jgi:hypothetical protein
LSKVPPVMRMRIIERHCSPDSGRGRGRRRLALFHHSI